MQRAGCRKAGNAQNDPQEGSRCSETATGMQGMVRTGHRKAGNARNGRLGFEMLRMWYRKTWVALITAFSKFGTIPGGYSSGNFAMHSFPVHFELT